MAGSPEDEDEGQQAVRVEHEAFSGGGLSCWLAPEAALAAAMAEQEVTSTASGTSLSAGISSVEQKWKEWSGKSEYKLGDISRGLVSSMQGKVRDIKHQLGEKALDMYQTHEDRVKETVDTMMSGGDEKVKDASQASASGSAGTNAERWWCQACQYAHKDHRREEDTASRPAHARGKVEVRLLPYSAEKPMVRSTGEAAAEPVVQLALEGVLTGAMAPPREASSAVEKPNESPKVTEAPPSECAFFFQELMGTDLRVHVWDRQSVKFSLGFEDQSFCGGAFLPLAAVVRQAGMVLSDGLSRQTFEVETQIQLLPLKLVRARRKLEPSEDSGATRPKCELGVVNLAIKLTLFEVPWALCFAEPVVAPPSLQGWSANPPGHVSDPVSTLKAAAATVARTGRVLNTRPWLMAFDQIREDPLSMILLQCWWAWISLQAPVCTWPFLLVLSMPPLAFKLRGTVAGVSKEEELRRLYVDEEESPTAGIDKQFERAREAAQKAVKGVIQVQVNILQLTEKLATMDAQAEKLKYAMALGDPGTSALCWCIALAAACLLGGVIQFLVFLAWLGALRSLLWFVVMCFLLPLQMRKVALDLLMQLDDLKRRLTGDTLTRLLMCFWERLPDAVEMCHLDLCERYSSSPGVAR